MTGPRGIGHPLHSPALAVLESFAVQVRSRAPSWERGHPARSGPEARPLSMRAGRPRPEENPLRNGESFHATGFGWRRRA